MVVSQKLKTELLYKPKKTLKSWSWRDNLNSNVHHSSIHKRQEAEIPKVQGRMNG